MAPDAAVERLLTGWHLVGGYLAGLPAGGKKAISILGRRGFGFDMTDEGAPFHERRHHAGDIGVRDKSAAMLLEDIHQAGFSSLHQSEYSHDHRPVVAG